MNSFRGGVAAGFIAGAFLAAGVVLLARPRPEPLPPAPVAPPPSAAVLDAAAALKEENRALKEKVAELEKAKAAAVAPPKADAKPEPEKTAAPELKSLFGKLAELGLGAFNSPKFKETLEAVKAAGKPGMEFLANILRTSKSATERFMAAALMEGSGDASEVDSLAHVLKGDGDDMVRRMASHALAVLGSPAAESPLRAATTEDTDWGVRVNSAYGLPSSARTTASASSARATSRRRRRRSTGWRSWAAWPTSRLRRRRRCSAGSSPTRRTRPICSCRSARSGR